MKKNRVLSFKYFIYDFLHIFTFLPGFIWWRPKHLYESEAAKKKIKGGGILISNHLGFTDPVFLMYGFWYRRLHFVALKVFFNTPMKRFWFRQFQCIPIDRENMSMDTFREIVGHLKNDEVVAIFPEGRINTTKEEIQPLKSGMILMAMQSGKPIYPVYIQKKKGIRYRLLVVVGEPIYVQQEGGMNLKGIENTTEKLYNKEICLKRIADSYYEKKSK